MEKQNIVYLHNGILFSYLKSDVAIHATIWKDIEYVMLNKISQTQKITNCMIPFILYFQNKHIYRDRKQMRGCQGLREGKKEESLLHGLGFSFRKMKNFCNDIVRMGTHIVKVLNVTDLYTLK